MKNSAVPYLRSPVFVWWDVTYACNLRCRHCYSSSAKALPNELSTGEAKELIRQLAEMQVFYVYFLGGEPLLRKDCLELAGYCRELGLATMMNTNGWLVNQEMAQRIAQLDFMLVRVSIDGAQAETHDAIRGVPGSFQRACQAIRFLREAGVARLGISPTVMMDNIDEMSALIDLAVSLEVDEMQMVQLCRTGRGSEVEPASVDKLMELKELFERRQRELAGILTLSATEGIETFERSKPSSTLPDFTGCMAGRTCAAVAADGKVRPCILYSADAGNLRSQSFYQIWHNSSVFGSMRQVAPECEGCLHAPSCSRECPVESPVAPQDRTDFVVSSSQ